MPTGGWGRTWALAILLVVMPLAGWELAWRAHGFVPRVVAEDESWILAFEHAMQSNTLVLGTSRIQAALEPESFGREIGGTVTDLALPATSPVPVLEYLADSTAYAGLVVVGILPMYVFDGGQGGAARATSILQRFATDRVSPARLSEDWLEVHALQHLVFRRPALLPARLAKTLLQGNSPEPSPIRLRADRFAPVYQRQLLARRSWNPTEGFGGMVYNWVERTGRPANRAEYAELKRRILDATGRIHARGGTVVLLYMGACGRRRDIEERRFPRARYWDPLAREAPAIAIATEDHPELSDFACWDGSHLDAGDAPAFARALGRIIREARMHS